MILPSWLSDDATKCYEIPEGTCGEVWVQKSTPIDLTGTGREVGQHVTEAWEALKAAQPMVSQGFQLAVVAGVKAIQAPPPDGRYWLVKEEDMCPECGGSGELGTAPNGKQWSCETCGGDEDQAGEGTLTTYRLVSETETRVTVWECPACGHPHVPLELTWSDPPSCKECNGPGSTPSLRFIGPEGQRYDTGRSP